VGALDQLLDRACTVHAKRVALVAADGALSYGALDRDARGLAAALRGRSLAPNEPVLVMVANALRDWVAFLGVWRAGGVVVPVHRSTPSAVIGAQRQATGARFIVDCARDAGRLEDGAYDGWLSITDANPPAPRPLLADAALIIFTSGSTGQPKGAVLSHAAVAGKLAANDSYLRFGAGERILLVLNITFSFGVWVSLLTLAKGGTLVVHERFRPETFLAS
jgi:long-chain acyl-CoA synthetase